MSDHTITLSRGELGLVKCALMTYVGQLQSVEPEQANEALKMIQQAMDQEGKEHERYTCWTDYVLAVQHLTGRITSEGA